MRILIILVWPTSWTPAVGGLIVCVSECELRCFTGMTHHSRDAATGFAAVTRCAQAAGVWKTDAGIKWPYQPKHSPIKRWSIYLYL